MKIINQYERTSGQQEHIFKQCNFITLALLGSVLIKTNTDLKGLKNGTRKYIIAPSKIITIYCVSLTHRNTFSRFLVKKCRAAEINVPREYKS